MTLTSIKTINLSKLLLFLSITIVLALAPFFVSPYYVKFLMIILYWTALTISWDFFSGLTNYVSLAAATFLGVGVYFMAILAKTFHFAIVVLLASVFCFIIALGIGITTLKLRGVYFAIFTFGLTELVKNVIQWWEINVNRTVGRFIVFYELNTAYHIMLIVTLATFLLITYLRNSKLGLALRLIGECEEAAVHLGVNASLYKTLGFALSSLLITSIGCSLSTQWTYVEPGIAFNINYAFTPLTMALLGGSGTTYGPILGALIYSLISEVLIYRYKGYYMITFGSTLVILVLFLPKGIAGVIKKLRELRMAGVIKKLRSLRIRVTRRS